MPYYAVKNGRVPGVYKDWPSCQEQVKEYPKAVFKKFPTEAEAWDFVIGVKASYGMPSASAASFTETTGTFSMSSSFHESGQHHKTSPSSSTSENQPQTDQSATYQAVGMLRATAKVLQTSVEQLMNGVGSLRAQIDHLAASLHPDGSISSGFSAGARIPDSLKRSYSDFTPFGRGGGCYANGFGNGSAKKYKKVSGTTDCGFTGVPFPDHEGIVVYTDGASFDNGYATARAGIGVFWGHNDPYNRSERLTGRQTNNRAEIHAAEVAARLAKERGIQNLILYTDSHFLINGITVWIKKWKKNGWKLSTGGDVVNREDFQKLDQTISGMNIKWMHVRGHCGIEGNEAADRLANEGAKKLLM